MITAAVWVILRDLPFRKKAVISIFAGYFFILLAGTLLMRQVDTVHRYQPEIFWTCRVISYGGRPARLMKAEVLINILMTVPVGFTAAMLAEKHRFITAFTAGFILSVSIECLQLILKRGLFEFDDIIYNTAGAMIGCAVFQILRCVHTGFQNRRLP